MRASLRFSFSVLMVLLFLVAVADCKKKKRKPVKESVETNLFNFLRIFLFRLIYGFASMVGAEEGVSDFMGGILAPPGTEDAEYKDYGDDYKNYDDDAEYY